LKGLEEKTQLNGATLAVAAFPVVSFALLVLARRAGELVGLRLPMGGLLIVASFGSGVLVLLAADPTRRLKCSLGLLLMIGYAIAAALLFRGIPDPGWDSQTYHLPSMLRLIAGWRPLIEPTDLTLSNVYPNAGWTLLGGFSELFGFESGRAISALLMLSVASLLWKVLRDIGMSAALAIAVTLACSANPIALSQLFTALSDGLVWYLTAILLLSLLIMLDDRRWIVTLTAMAALMLLINIKLSGIYFATIVTIVIVISLLCRGWPSIWALILERRVQIGGVAIAFALSLGFVGWRPFITNLRDYQTIIYPSPDELGYRPGSGDQVPDDLQGKSRLQKFLSLCLARTDVAGRHNDWKVPGTITTSELNMDSVTRVGGFGPLFGAAMIVGIATFFSGVVIAISCRYRPCYRAVEAPMAIFVLSLLTTILFPEPWWARFVPIAWLMPSAVAVLGFVLVREARLGRRLVGVLLGSTVAVCIINSVIVGVLTVRESLFWSGDIANKLAGLSRDPGPLYLSEGTMWNPTIRGQHAGEDVWRRRLEDLGRTDVVVVPRGDCKNGRPLSVDVMHCASTGEYPRIKGSGRVTGG